MYTPYSCPVSMKLEFSPQFFEKYSNIKFHENPFSGGRVVPCGRMDGRTVRHTDMTKLIVAIRNIPNAPKTWYEKSVYFITIALEYAILQVQVNRKGLGRMGHTYHIVVYVDCLNLLGGNINTIKKNTETSLYNSKEVGPASKC